MSYKNNASANRDALFGSAGGSSSKSKSKKKSTKSDRDDLFGSASGGSGGKSSSSSSSRKPSSSGGGGGRPSTSSSSSSKLAVPTSTGYKYTGPKKKIGKSSINVGLTGEARDAKIKEAEDYRDKAKKAMQKGIFSKPDPLAASTYYKRAADAYQQCGENRLERSYRINSADCQMRCGAYATAAAEYTRAAELVEDADDEELDMKREIGRKLLLQASEAWMQMNEPGKAATTKVQAALALTWGDESSLLPKAALAALEEAVEAHVPDPLNPYSRYRQTGVSAYINPDADGETAENPSIESLELANQHIVTRPYAHESVQEVVYVLISFGEYPSALYAQGAVTTLLERDGVSTLTLSRSYVGETILTLAMGDPVAAEQEFLNRHVQKTTYLSSRECKLGEELFRAIKTRDGEALEEARSIKGTNRAAIGNLHESLRDVITMIRLSGVARRGGDDMDAYKKKSSSKKSSTSSDKKKKKSSSWSSSSSNKGGFGFEEEEPPEAAAKIEEPSFEDFSDMKTGYEDDVDAAEKIDAGALQNELDALDFGDDDDDESDLDDDDIDLR